jgi:hypothetical protein
MKKRASRTPRKSAHKTTGSEVRRESKRLEAFQRDQEMEKRLIKARGPVKGLRKARAFSSKLNFFNLDKRGMFWADMSAHFYGSGPVEKMLALGFRGPGIYAASWLGEKVGWDEFSKIARRLKHKGKSDDITRMLFALEDVSKIKALDPKEALRIYEEQKLRGDEVYYALSAAAQYGEKIMLKTLNSFRSWREGLKKNATGKARELVKHWEKDRVKEILFDAGDKWRASVSRK